MPRPATRSASWIDAANPLEIVGLSNNELRASYFVGYYLKRHGYRVLPGATEILGETSYASLLDPVRRDQPNRHHDSPTYHLGPARTPVADSHDMEAFAE